MPADGRVSWTARDDAAEAAAVILSSGRAHDGPTTLTATSAPTFDELATIASELSGQTIEFAVKDAEEWVADQIATGQPELMARFTLGMYQAAHEGFFAGVDPLLGELLGREPRGVGEFLAAEPPGH